MKTSWLKGWGEDFPTLVVLYAAALLCTMFGTNEIEAQQVGAAINMLIALWIILFKPPLGGLNGEVWS